MSRTGVDAAGTNGNTAENYARGGFVSVAWRINKWAEMGGYVSADASTEGVKTLQVK